ncbi:DMT family transporter [Ahrensia sp. R2A130]|uniref:DMT family transporter n=1 Tax=Ahrensia sp. R2A130 TaxID=744979 RepID=UPI0001E0837B|nr:DMT family transporter [Ahrensia sp. R2A130]EFL91023.1 MFS family transporter [Ahrensia sp. R2A130]
MNRTTANLLLLFAGLIWGGGFVAQQTAMEDIGPFAFMMLRFGVAGLAVLPFAIWEARRHNARPINAKTWRNATAVGLFFFVAMALQQIGILGTTVTNAGILTGLYVVLTPIILRVLLGETQQWIIWPAALMAFCGIYLLGGGGLGELTWGDGVIIISAIFAAGHVIAMDRAVTGADRPGAVACVQFVVSAALSAVGFIIARALNWWAEPALSTQTLWNAAPEIAYAALLAGALAFTLMAVCQQYTRAADAAVLLSSEALFAALGGALLLGERLSIIGYAGCALMFAAIIVVSVVSARLEAKSAPNFT